MRWTREEKNVVNLWRVRQRKRNKAWQRAWRTALIGLQATGKPWLMVKVWPRGKRRFEVDYELREAWLATLNDCADACGAIITSFCAGHPHGVSGQGNCRFAGGCGPSLTLWCRRREIASLLALAFTGNKSDVELYFPASLKLCRGSARLRVECTILHTGNNQRELARWWSDIIARFRRAVRKL